jgi:hypothetical protein
MNVEGVMTMTEEMPADLVPLPEFPFPVLVSPATLECGWAIARRCQHAKGFLSQLLGRDIALRVFVLAPEYWSAVTGTPMYGVPQTIDPRTLVMAGQRSDLWSTIVPPPERLSRAAMTTLAEVYGQHDGALDLMGFMELLAVHELGHLFIDQATNCFDYRQPRRWLIELFCNLALHASIVTLEPGRLLHLVTLPQTIVAAGHQHLPHTALADFERLYADMEPPNFVWYLSQLHVAAEVVYNAGGAETVERLFQALVEAGDSLTDEALAVSLSEAVQPAVARVPIDWPAA